MLVVVVVSAFQEKKGKERKKDVQYTISVARKMCRTQFQWLSDGYCQIEPARLSLPDTIRWQCQHLSFPVATAQECKIVDQSHDFAFWH